MLIWFPRCCWLHSSGKTVPSLLVISCDFRYTTTIWVSWFTLRSVRLFVRFSFIWISFRSVRSFYGSPFTHTQHSFIHFVTIWCHSVHSLLSGERRYPVNVILINTMQFRWPINHSRCRIRCCSIHSFLGDKARWWSVLVEFNLLFTILLLTRCCCCLLRCWCSAVFLNFGGICWVLIVVDNF